MRFSPKLIAALLALALPGMAQVTMGGGVSAGGGTLMCVPSTVGAPVFSPAPGTYSTPQTVTITCPIAGQTAVVRSDGGFVSAASPLYTGPMTTSVTTTYQTECVTFGGTTGNLTHQANTQASNTGFVCHTAAGGTYTGPPSITCTSSGGVIGSPTNVVASFPGGSSPATFTVTTPATSGTQTQDLNVFQFGGSLDPSASTCDNCTSEVKDIVFTVVGAGMANQENDMPQYDPTHGNTDRQNGTQCQGYGSGAIIAVDSGNAGGWTTTPISCSNWTAGTKHEIVNRVDHDLTGSCPGGNGCALYRYYVIDNVYNAMSGNYGNTQGYNTNTGAAWGWQFQPDMKTTSGTAATGGWTVSSATVALTMGDDTATVTGTYTINPIGSATPVLGPFAIANMTGNNANYKPSSALTFGKQGHATSSMAIPITISNCANSLISACSGSGPLTVSSMAITGTNASDFTLAGSCGTVASGSDCEPTITFTPTAASGTNESATLTVNYSGATVTSQTMSLTGTSATVTTESACFTAAANTNYQLTGNISAAGSCILDNVANVDINLNGHTLTYCTAGGTALVGGVYVNGYNETAATIHNGTITEAAGKTCTGVTSDDSGQGSSDFMVSSGGSSSQGFGNSFFNLNLSQNDGPGHIIFEEYAGATTALFTTVHDVSYVMNGVQACGSVGCRAENQFYAINVDSSQNAAPFQFYNIGGTGGTQGGVSATSPGSGYAYTLLSPGNTTATNTNGFTYQVTQSNSTVSNNLTTGSGSGGACLSCRGIQIGAFNNPVTGVMVSNNSIFTTYLANNTEYSGCPLGGSYGMQLNTAGSGEDLSNNTFQNNWVVTTANACESVAFSFSNATNGSGPNKTINNHFECDLASGSSAYPCNGMQFVGKEYSPAPDGSLVSTGDTILGDTSALYIGYDGTSSWTCNQCTFGKGKNPASGWVLLDYDEGFVSGGGSSNFVLVDPTFTGGATQSQNNLSTWASNNHSLSFQYDIEWTYTITVEKSSNSAPITGATVSVADSTSTNQCSTTTNSSGVATCTLKSNAYQAISGTYSTPTFNPMAITVTASGCTTGNYSETITATTAETKKLSGC